MIALLETFILEFGLFFAQGFIYFYMISLLWKLWIEFFSILE